MRSILVLNVGSSTLKFGVFQLSSGDDALLRGVLDRSGNSAGELRTIDAAGRSRSVRVAARSDGAIGGILRIVRDQLGVDRIEAVGHRLVHGGSTMRRPVTIDSGLRAELERLIPLAPEHLPE